MTYTPIGGSPITIEYSLQDEFQFEIEDQDGFKLEAGDLKQFLVLLNLDALFDGIDFSSATPDGDGIVRINSNSNSHLAEQMGSNLEDILDVGEDADNDNEIDG